MIKTQFYRELGKYLYAVALADGTIEEKELVRFEKLIDHELKTAVSILDPLEQKEVIFIKLEFYNCIREKKGLTESRSSFLNFIRKYAGAITDYQRNLAMHLIHEVADAYGGRKLIENLLENEAKKYLNLNSTTS